MVEALVVLAFLPDPDPSWGSDPLPFVLLMLLGFLVGIAGHVTQVKGIVITGLGMIFLATFLLPLGIYISQS